MVKDNQDYFKRGGRSGGPAGPLHHFRQKLGQERAVLSRGEERGFPGHRPPTYHQPGEPPEIPGEHPRPAEAEAGQRPNAEAGHQAEPETGRHVPQTETQSFGPPADYDAAVGHGPGAQEIPPDRRDTSALFAGWAERHPQPFRVALWIGRRLEAPAGRAILFAKRLKRTLDDVRR